MSHDRDYVLGTHDDEISRLALQHRVWRPRALDAWRRAGFTVGQTLLDVGCGPGHASIDLAEIVEPSGQIVAIDRSRRFLDALEAKRLQRGLHNITTLEFDLDAAGPPTVGADGAWARWVVAFVKHPRDLLARVGEALKRGGVLVVHEYFDYGTWRVTPRSPEIEEFVRAVMESWRANGGGNRTSASTCRSGSQTSASRRRHSSRLLMSSRHPTLFGSGRRGSSRWAFDGWLTWAA
jgi:SAM-dependent methyltransferase